MKKPLPACMWGAGFLGHTWCVTVKDGHGGERLLLQANDGARAAQTFDEEGDNAVAIYTRTRRSWKRVPRRVAVLDGDA